VDPITTFLGVLLLGFGAYNAYARFRDPSKLGKLEPLRKLMGPKLGGVVHFAAYTVVPIAAGILFVVSGMRGIKVI